MARTLFAALGILLALFPNRITDWYQRVAFENPDEAVGKEWLGSVVRTEGVLFALGSLRGGRSYAWLMNLTGIAGGIVLLFPKQYLDFGARLVYQNPEEIVWKDRFVQVARGLGVLYVVLSLRALKQRCCADRTAD